MDPPRDLLDTLIRSLTRRRLAYADARWESTQHERLIAEQGRVSVVSRSESVGIGIRVLADQAWGFAATDDLRAAALARAVDRAIDLARAAASIRRVERALAPAAPATARLRSEWATDPFTVPLARKLAHLVEVNTALLGPRAITQATTSMDFSKRRTLFVSTEGAGIDQEIVESGAGLTVVARQGGLTQVRSFPNSHQASFAQAGYEHVRRLNLLEGAQTARREVLQLLRARPPKPGPTTLILDSTQLALQLHESCGHPTELDRVLGREQSFAGGSFLTPDRLGTFQYGSPHVTIVADATIPGALGSLAYDDEGVPGQRTVLVDRGRFVGYLSSRETAAVLGLPSSSGAMRADGWQSPPLIRMTNINLEPGQATLEELLAGVTHGYLLATNRSWSIDDQRLNFQFTTEIGWEIRRGRVGAIVRNPLYTGLTPEFWSRCTGVSHRADWRLWGLPTCGKGEPMQLMRVGHGAPYARFDGVTVGPAR